MTSICIFGSEARRSSDGLSDKDVLIISRDRDQCEMTIDKWQLSGWNVAHFNYQRFKKMAQFGSLFVQHIKLEGCILEDDGFLKETLCSYTPRGDYAAQLMNSIKPFEWDEPVTYWQKLCMADILYVAFRNSAVLANGIDGRYLFDFTSLANAVAVEAKLNSSQSSTLISLRRLKKAYREREVGLEDEFNWLEISNALKLVAECFRAKCYQRFDRSPSPPLSVFVPNGYHKLRQHELALLKDHDPRVLDTHLPDSSLYEIWKLICGPDKYDKLQQFAKDSSFFENSLDGSLGRSDVYPKTYGQ